ncbi:hypothetical protein [Streptomyces niveus]|uniref:hypothetical protein n=1 Tax=Streptomyces niveus TaxID=193462 RepID=UPI00369DD3FF
MGKLTQAQRQQQTQVGRRSEALQTEEDDRRVEERRQQWRQKGMYLSPGELAAGHPCRSCGEPFRDGLGSWPPLLQMTPEERTEHDATKAEYTKRHAECRAVHWTVRGSRTQHCSVCCPPPPMGEEQTKAIAKILFSPMPEKRHLDDWDLTLTCDHTVRHTQHRDHQRYSTAVVACPTCGTRRGVVGAVHIGPSDDPEGEVQQERLATELQAAEAKLERQRKTTAKTEQQVAKIVRKLGADAEGLAAIDRGSPSTVGSK